MSRKYNNVLRDQANIVETSSSHLTRIWGFL